MSAAMEEFPRRHRITVEEYLRMDEVGLLGPEPRTELIEGEIIDMPPINPPHAGAVARLTQLLIYAVGGRAIVWPQGPVRLGDFSMPQPDFALLTPREDFYTRKHPTPDDILLAIEVSESTLRYDQQRKAPLYARHGIPELWIFDIKAKQVYVSRNPTPDGYQHTFTADQPASMPIASLPGVTLDISSVIAL